MAGAARILFPTLSLIAIAVLIVVVLGGGGDEAPVVPEAPPTPEQVTDESRPEPDPDPEPVRTATIPDPPTVEASETDTPTLSAPNIPNRIVQANPIGSSRVVGTTRMNAAPSSGGSEHNQQEFLDNIRDSFSDAREGLRECYELVLELEPDLNDRLLFTIDVFESEGSEGVGALQSIEAGEMGVEHLDCFADVVDGMRFPPPNPTVNEQGERNDSYMIRYPVVLSSDGG